MLGSREFEKNLPLFLPFLKEKSNEAQKTFFNKCYNGLSNYVLKRCNSKADCDEIIPDIFSRCFKNAHYYTPDNFKNWFFKFTYRSVVDYYRDKDKEKIDSVILSKEIIEIVPKKEGEDQTEIDSRNECFQKFYEVLAKLSIDDRNIIISLLEGVSPVELAGMINTSIDVLKQRIHRARIRLFNILTDEPYFGDDEHANKFIRK